MATPALSVFSESKHHEVGVPTKNPTEDMEANGSLAQNPFTENCGHCNLSSTFAHYGHDALEANPHSPLLNDILNTQPPSSLLNGCPQVLPADPGPQPPNTTAYSPYPFSPMPWCSGDPLPHEPQDFHSPVAFSPFWLCLLLAPRDPITSACGTAKQAYHLATAAYSIGLGILHQDVEHKLAQELKLLLWGHLKKELLELDTNHICQSFTIPKREFWVRLGNCNTTSKVTKKFEVEWGKTQKIIIVQGKVTNAVEQA
ncbi:hypothetical protein JB92DRAFT_2830283 [Gautieria morchelliformis]|nr:hypothetical protein JB92DRAFT_2830283 [Gautieria morchelliformis]